MARDTLLVLDRTGNFEKFLSDKGFAENYLRKTLPQPYVWWVRLIFPNGTEKNLHGLRQIPLQRSVEVTRLFVKKEIKNPNPSFEEGNGGNAYYWIEGNFFNRSDDNYKFGSYSMKGVFSGLDSYSYSIPLTLEPNTNYLLSGWIYDSLTTGYAYIDLNDTDFECELVPTTKDSWEYLSCNFTTPSSLEDVVIRIGVAGNGVGKVWFDEVKIEKYVTILVKLGVGYPY